MTLEELVYRKYNERQAVYKKTILTGVDGWHEYQRLVGYLQGMSDFLSDIDPYLKNPEDAEESDDE